MRRFFILLFLIISYVSLFSQSQSNNKFISLSPSITEIFFAIGAEESLTGVISPNNYPKEASKIEVVASYGFINYERIFTLKPKECLTIEGMQSTEELSRLRNLKISVTEYKIESIEDLYKVILDIGERTGKRETALNCIEKIKKVVDKNDENIPEQKGLFVVGLDPLIVTGKGSFLNDVLKKCGIRNVFEDQSPSYFTPTFEKIIEKKPEIVLIPAGEINSNSKDNFIKNLKKFVSSIKVIEVEADLIMRPSVRISEGIEKIREKRRKN